MCSRESLSRRCVLVKKVPEEFIYQCIYNIRGVEKCQRHNELSIGNGEETLIVLFRSEEDAENLLKKGYVTLDSSGKMFDLPVVGCSEFFIPNDWIYPFHKLDLSFINTMEDSIRMKSVGLMEEGKKIDCDNTNVKVGKEKEDKLEDIESQDIYIPKFTIPSITSPYNSTVAQVAVLSAENFQREEIKDLEKQQRRESYVKKEKLCTESPRPSVGRSEERTHGHEEEETDEETSFDTVRVRLRKPLSQGAIENYFENRRKSGGGDIESFEVIKEEDEQILEALITFRQSSDAKSCLQRRHKIGGHNLTVEKYDLNDPEMWEMNKVLVKNLFPGTTDDTLMNYLEPAAGVDPIEVVRGSKPDTVIVVFEEKPDFSKMSKRCNSRKLNGKSLFIQMVEKCRSVYAQDIDESFTYDTVENFFCNKKRSGGGEVEELDYHPEDGYCVVLFENPEDAENVASREKFTMNGKEIKVQMLYSQLGLPEQPINWADLPSIIFPCEKHFIKFVKNCEVVAKEIDNTMQQKFVKVEWPKSKSDFNVKLLCSVTKEVENARGNLKKWKEEAEKSMKSLVGKYSVQKHSISPESWGNFLDKLNMLNIDHPEKVAVSLEAKQHVVVVVGLEENTEALTRKILDIVKAEELKIKTQKEKIEKNVPLDFHKCQQLLNTDYQRMINDFPDVEIKIGKKGVNFTGKPNDVNEAIIKMHEYLINTKSKSIFQGINEGFKTKEVRKFLAKNQKGGGDQDV
ncbi:uncharacterized protein LOC134266406 [Saccostrea cucullata]|uniref:uncharacterized protein LOC134266406 n=1 Tax=Saccostrea cuccullata TaxID=36930 RepID=UPI002ED5B8AD